MTDTDLRPAPPRLPYITVPATLPGSGFRNGMPVTRRYRYRGTGEDTLTAFMDGEPEDARGAAEWPGYSDLCGSVNGARLHRKHGEKPCRDCRDAENADSRKRHAARKARREAQQEGGTA